MAMDDLSDHPFAVHMEAERAGSSTSKWERWIAAAENVFGKSLDGNQDDDGYSLDWALEVFESGSTAEEFVAMIGTDAKPSFSA